MLSATAFSILGSLRNALLCPHPGCNVLLRKPVSLPCGHNLCAECATIAIDDEDGCSVCNKPCWGKDARTNHHMARVIEHVTSLMNFSEKARGLQDEIVRLEAAVATEKTREASASEGLTALSRKRSRQQSPLQEARLSSCEEVEEGAALLATSLSPAVVQASSNPLQLSQASERKAQKLFSPASPVVCVISSPTRRAIDSEAAEKLIIEKGSTKSPRSIRVHNLECSPTEPIKEHFDEVVVSPTRSVGRNGEGRREEESPLRKSTRESPKKVASSAVLRKRLATSAVDASQTSEIDATGSQPTFSVAKMSKTAAVSRSIEIIDESNSSWSQRLSSSAVQLPTSTEAQVSRQLLDDLPESSQSDGPVAKRPKAKANNGQSQRPLDDGSPPSKTLLSVAKASGLATVAPSKPLHKAVLSSLGHLIAPSSRSGIGTLPLVSTSSLSAKTTQLQKQMPPPPARAIKAPEATTTFSSRFGQGGAERAQRTGKIVLMPSSLSEEERDELKRLVTLIGRSSSIHTGDFDPSVVTHLIVPCVNSSSGNLAGKRLCTRTIKYASAVLCGCWVLDIEWVRKSLADKALAKEADFEVYSDKLLLDSSISSPQLGRESAQCGKKQMLTGRAIFVKEPLCKLSKAELVIALQCSGTTILKSDPLEAAASKRPISEAAPLVITSYDLSGGALGSSADNERVAYAVAAKRVGLVVVDQLWFLDSVSRWKVEDESRYTLEGVCVKALRKTR